MKRKIFITGANGFIGSNLCRCFLAEGFEVYGLVRKTSDLHFLDSLPVRLVYGDLREPEGISFPSDIEYFVHSAAIVSDLASVDESEAGIYIPTVNFVRRLADLGIRPRRFVYISTTLCLGYLERNISEDRPGKSTDFMPYSRAKKKTEAFLLEKARNEGFPVVILRPGDVYGPNDRTSCAKILRGIEKGIPVIVGSGRHLFAYCYVDNLCQAVRLALEKAGIEGRAFVVTNSELPTWRAFFSGLQMGLGKKQRVYVPVGMAMALASLQELQRRLWPRSEVSLTLYRIRRITTETTYDVSRTIAELGYRPDNDTEKQVQCIVNWYLEEKKKGYLP